MNKLLTFQQLLCLDPRINGTKSEGGPANLKKGCCKSSAAVAL